MNLFQKDYGKRSIHTYSCQLYLYCKCVIICVMVKPIQICLKHLSKNLSKICLKRFVYKTLIIVVQNYFSQMPN